ncbi:MAG: TetR/AcrR family transcriptional regulator [Myxococcota bacterium]|nr:TetR/AcrR family transcriptional regulator [Myxococcota bacterium]
MPPETESQLTPRQRQVLDRLENLVVDEELADMTMAQIAAQVNCSLRTLYGISPSKEELVMTVMDRRLHRIGRAAIASLNPDDPPLANLRRYLFAANEAVQFTAGALVQGFAKFSGARRLTDRHESYVVAVVKSLLDRAMAEGVIERVDSAALAHVLGGLGRDFIRADIAAAIAQPPADAANAVTEILLRGLENR